ncbi:MAG: hypothetical protein RR033_02250 [Clostridia bacterium]
MSINRKNEIQLNNGVYPFCEADDKFSKTQTDEHLNAKKTDVLLDDALCDNNVNADANLSKENKNDFIKQSTQQPNLYINDLPLHQSGLSSNARLGTSKHVELSSLPKNQVDRLENEDCKIALSEADISACKVQLKPPPKNCALSANTSNIPVITNESQIEKADVDKTEKPLQPMLEPWENKYREDVCKLKKTIDGCTPADIRDNKFIAILAYLGPSVIITYLFAHKSRFARFHTNQALLLYLATFLYSVVLNLVGRMYIPYLMEIMSIGLFLFPILDIYGIINVIRGRAIELPKIGRFRIINDEYKGGFNK